ncbi:hypothetical protein FRB99_006735 [Tulasnella sp. 403]|nr:hypothetical protein FRB99_006735 [Tulasnella sp. 403]
MSVPFLLEKQVAIAAVSRACHLTTSLFNSLRSSDTLTKSDTSPVTVADFSAQAVVNSILSAAFPQDPIIGEEDSADLRGDAGRTLREKVTQLANDALSAPLVDQVIQEQSDWGVGPGVIKSSDDLLSAIDRGNALGGPTGRFWCLDPIDGTKGFIRGDQYAVCLALVIDAVVQVGVIGCPNLPFGSASDQGHGSIFVAVRGQGAEKFPFPLASLKPVALSIPKSSDPQLRFLESVEAAHSSHSFASVVSEALQVTTPPLRMDSQAKYCTVAAQSSGGDIYLRLPVPGKNYIEKIWDHAAGALIIEESGGIVSDSFGRPLNFGLGRTLGENFGIVACASGDVHSRVIRAIGHAREQQSKLN